MMLFRSALEKVGTGLLYGLGFGITAGAIYYFVSERMMASVWNDKALDQVVITKHEEVRAKELVEVLGTVENKSADTTRGLTIQVDLFDKTGRFVDQCQQYLSGGLRAGESRNFKVTCGGKEKPVAEHETYKVLVNGM